MPEIPKIVLPHGGYKKLIVYRKSDVDYLKSHGLSEWPRTSEKAVSARESSFETLTGNQ